MRFSAEEQEKNIFQKSFYLFGVGASKLLFGWWVWSILFEFIEHFGIL